MQKQLDDAGTGRETRQEQLRVFRAEPEEGGRSIYRQYMLPVTGEVALRTQCWFPKDAAELSVVVTRTCYPQQEVEFTALAETYVEHGIGFIVQWCRGTNGSDGDWEPNTHERGDGLALMEWVASLPFVKNIGYWGNSYLASAGWCMADVVPQKVKSMYLGVYGTDRYTSVYKDGLFRQDIFTAWTMANAGQKITADYLESCAYRPQMAVDESLWGVRLDWYRDWISNTDRDSDYWSHEGFWRMMGEIPQKLQIPVFICEGWYDHHLGSAVASWKRLSEKSRRNSTLQVGPWRHEYDCRLDGQTTDQLTDDSVSSPLAWFEETLKKEKLPQKTCRLYVIGADEWRTYDELPENGDCQEILYLNAGADGETDNGQTSAARLDDAKKRARVWPEDTGTEAEPCGMPKGISGTLCGEIPARQERITYTYDPQNPVRSHGTESCFQSKEAIGSLYQPPCGYRADVLSFVSQPIPEQFEIIGNIKVSLFVSSDAKDTAFTAKVMEIFEDGTCVNIRSSITTLAYRNGAVRRGRYHPGDVEEICIEMWPVAWKMRSKSRIRVDVSSSDFPQYAVHSNYPGIWSQQERTKTAQQTVYTGGTYASRVILPVSKRQ